MSSQSSEQGSSPSEIVQPEHVLRATTPGAASLAPAAGRNRQPSSSRYGSAGPQKPNQQSLRPVASMLVTRTLSSWSHAGWYRPGTRNGVSSKRARTGRWSEIRHESAKG